MSLRQRIVDALEAADLDVTSWAQPDLRTYPVHLVRYSGKRLLNGRLRHSCEVTRLEAVTASSAVADGAEMEASTDQLIDALAAAPDVYPELDQVRVVFQQNLDTLQPAGAAGGRGRNEIAAIVLTAYGPGI